MSSGLQSEFSKNPADNNPVDTDDEIMSSAATGLGTPIQINGKGVINALITLPDTNSADGEFYWCVADAEADFAAGNYKQLSIPVVSKIGGVALLREPLTLVNPGARWACPRYVRSAGGAAGEITLTKTVW